jgi:hypothetical protein
VTCRTCGGSKVVPTMHAIASGLPVLNDDPCFECCRLQGPLTLEQAAEMMMMDYCDDWRERRDMKRIEAEVYESEAL